jgi:hypothetical protein
MLISSLQAAIQETFQNWSAENGGMATGFVFVAELLDPDGDNLIAVTEMDNQYVSRCMGLTTYADAWYRDDVARYWTRLEREGSDGE